MHTVRADHGADDSKALRNRTRCKLTEACDHGGDRKEVRDELDRRVVYSLEVVRDERQRAKRAGERVEGEDEAECDEATDWKRSGNWQVRWRVENRILTQEGLSFSVASRLRGGIRLRSTCRYWRMVDFRVASHGEGERNLATGNNGVREEDASIGREDRFALLLGQADDDASHRIAGADSDKA